MSEKSTEIALEQDIANRLAKLSLREIFWRDHQPWLKECGYRLRPRYQPDWVASWKQDPLKRWDECEDSLTGMSSVIMDAVRDDGKPVALKRVRASRTPGEAAIGQLFSSEPLAGCSSNYCVPILDVLQVPDDDDSVILIMPFLYKYYAPGFKTIGEAVEFCRQLFEGLNFMHRNLVYHGDIKFNNVMADLLHLYKLPPHPFSRWRTLDLQSWVKTQSSRTRTPVKYFLVDFGLSHRYEKEDTPYMTLSNWGAGDRSIPEFQACEDSLCDPFAVDVYCVGNTIRERFLDGNGIMTGFEFMHELIADMVQDNPKARPTMDQVVSRFDDIMGSLSTWKLRSPVANTEKQRAHGTLCSIIHWTKQLRFMAKRIPAIPRA